MVRDDHAFSLFSKDQVSALAWSLVPALAPQAPDRLDRPHPDKHLYTVAHTINRSDQFVEQRLCVF